MDALAWTEFDVTYEGKRQHASIFPERAVNAADALTIPRSPSDYCANAALREATRGSPVSPSWVADRDLRHINPPDPKARLAAVTRAKAAVFGLTTELATITPYDLPRAWAAGFRQAGFAGIRHELRHDPRARPSGVSLFGRGDNPRWPDGRRQPLHRADAEAAGVTVIDVPPSAALTILS
jgi:hypothetical protein